MTTVLASTQEFLAKHGMDYTVLKTPAIVARTNQDGTTSYDEVPRQFHLVRSTDQHVVSPKTVGSGYTPVNPMEMFAPVEHLIAEGWITPNKCYHVNDGQHEIVSFKIDGGMLPEKGTIVGEEWDHFFQLHNIHGGGAFYGNLFCRRKICMNGAVRIVRKGGGFRLRHSKLVQVKYKEAIETWNEIQEEIAALAKRMQAWTDTAVTATESLRIFDLIYDIDRTEKVNTRTQNELDFAVREFSNPMLGTYGRSLADVYNAITATNTHYKPKNSRETEARWLASMFNNGGSRSQLEGRAIEVLANV